MDVMDQQKKESLLKSSLVEPALIHLESEYRGRLQILLEEEGNLEEYLARTLSITFRYAVRLQENPRIDPVTREAMVVAYLLDSIGRGDYQVSFNSDENERLLDFKKRYDLDDYPRDLTEQELEFLKQRGNSLNTPEIDSMIAKKVKEFKKRDQIN